MTTLPTGTVTFLFTDIEGSTKRWQEHPAAMPAALARHHSILNECIALHGGYVFQIIGDAFCAAFAVAMDGLEAALAAQRALASEPWGETGPVRVRMALHTGTAQVRAGEYTSGEYVSGLTLSRAARFLSAGHGGQILLSDAARALIENDLPPGVTLRDLGRHRLKDLARAEPISQVVASDLPSDFPPLKSLDALPNNLPIQLTNFIGREKELAEVKRLLNFSRLVTLTGSGGTGKTRLALQAGAEVLDTFADGVWVVELAVVSNPELVPQAVASALGIREVAGPPMVALQDSLQTKYLLLILDNCEHLLQPCADLADTLLHTCPALKIVATSREPLGIAGESILRIPSLSLPDPHQLPAIDRLSQFDAVRLFIDRAVSAKPDFQVTNANAPAVAQLCHRLDGIPLALELAAARVKGLAVEQIAARLDDRFRLLTGGSRTALPRQQTLRASIDWSYDLLSEAERTALRRLSVFVGDWTLEAAEVVVGQDGILSEDVLDLLLRLVDKSLVATEEQAGAAHYRLLETIREYADARLHESGEADRVRVRHLDFFLTFAEHAESKLSSSEDLVWLEQRRSDYRNLQIALDRARAGKSAEPKLRLARAAEQLADVQDLLGFSSQAVPLYQSALELWHAEVGADKRMAWRLHGKIVRTVASLKWRIDFDRFKPMLDIAAASRAYLESEFQSIEQEPSNPELVRVLTALSWDAWSIQNPGDWTLAEKYARAAGKMAEKLDAPAELSDALAALGDVHYNQGRLREHMQISLRRMALSRDPRFGNRQAREAALIEAGYALLSVGEYDQAMPLVAEAQDLAPQTSAIILDRWALELRTYCLFRLDRWDEMLQLDDQLQDMRRRYPREQIGPSCFSIGLIASVHALRGELELGAEQRAQAHKIMTTVTGGEENWVRIHHY